MLVLTRKKNQSIMIGDNIVLTVLEIRDEAISIGIEAPANITILRSELYNDVKEENLNVLANKKDADMMIKNLLKAQMISKE